LQIEDANIHAVAVLVNLTASSCGTPISPQRERISAYNSLRSRSHEWLHEQLPQDQYNGANASGRAKPSDTVTGRIREMHVTAVVHGVQAPNDRSSIVQYRQCHPHDDFEL
jgi:hypothetical protein